MRVLLAHAAVHTPLEQARSVLIDGERVLALDASESEAEAVIDLRGRAVVPAFVDAHGHLLAFAASLMSVDCRGAKDMADLQSRIRAVAERTPAGEWIRAYGYDENDLTEGRHPTRSDLDGAAPDHPVRLAHRGGHAVVLNTLALRRCGVDTEIAEPAGAYVDREVPSGEPSGLFFEMGDVLDARIPPISPAEMDLALAQAEVALLRAGVAAFHDCGARNGPGEWESLSRLSSERDFRPRLVAASGWPAWSEGYDIRELAPAVAGSHVKLMLSELGDDVAPDADELSERVARVHAAGHDVAIHAVTARGVRAAVDAIDRALALHPRRDHRHRIEHASICSPELMPRMAALGITVVSQPAFIYANGERYLRTVPPADLPNLYAFGSMAEAGVHLAFGSDCPFGRVEPLIGLRSAYERRAANGAVLCGRPMWPAAALAASTLGAARAAGIEDEHGWIRPGARADLVGLSKAPESREAQIEAVLISGRVVAGRASLVERLETFLPIDTQKAGVLW
ncbi:MAG TPA: amidohydrolase [Dehalococcoidia bacterium]|nr:amidohydrolase [Dehalococcoidia bacterium]